MAGDSISVDDLLADQGRPGRLLVTIEALPEDDRVKVTPYISGGGCQCSSALKVPKEAIKGLRTTNELHDCCGKRLKVVEVDFADATLADVFEQLATTARETQRPFDVEVGPYPSEGLFIRGAGGAGGGGFPGEPVPTPQRAVRVWFEKHCGRCNGFQTGSGMVIGSRTCLRYVCTQVFGGRISCRTDGQPVSERCAYDPIFDDGGPVIIR